MILGAFASLYVETFIRPRRAAEALMGRPERLRYGALAVAITAAVYLLVYFFLSRNGGRPTVFRPWLAIPAEVYYRYNLLLIVPSLLLAWIASAGFTQLVARGFGGTGTFEDTLAVLGMGLSVSTWWTGLHDLVTTCLGYMWVIDQPAYEDAMNSPTPARTLLWFLMLGYALWFVRTFTLGVAVAHRLRTLPAVISGVVGFGVYQLVFLIFNR